MFSKSCKPCQTQSVIGLTGLIGDMRHATGKAYLLLQLMHEAVLLSLQGHHLLLGLLLLRGRELQQGDVRVFFTNGCQQGLLPEGMNGKRRRVRATVSRYSNLHQIQPSRAQPHTQSAHWRKHTHTYLRTLTVTKRGAREGRCTP